MSQAPHVVHLRDGTKMGNTTLVDTMVHDGLTDSIYNIHMGQTAENVANQYNVNRQQQDAVAATSQQLAECAQKNGYFKEEIVSVTVTSRSGSKVISEDAYPKHGTTLEVLGKLRPCFVKDGSVTAGNASGVNDSAAAVLLVSEDELTRRNLIPFAKIIAFAQTGIDPKIMGMGPVSAIEAVVCLYSNK